MAAKLVAAKPDCASAELEITSHLFMRTTLLVLGQACASCDGGRLWASQRQKHERRWQTPATTWQRRPSGSSATACERAVQVERMQQQRIALACFCLYQLLSMKFLQTHGVTGTPGCEFCS